MQIKIWFVFISISSMIYYFCIVNLYSVFENYLFDKDENIRKPCRVPKLNPFDESILYYMSTPENITCFPNKPLIDSDSDYLYVNKHLLPYYGIKKINKFLCYYQAFERKIPEETEADDQIVYVGKRKRFFYKIKVEDEFVEVICKNDRVEIYYDVFSFVPIKHNKNRKNLANIKQKLNVLMVAIDSLSLMNFHRKMPKTKKYVDEELNSIVISGYNKVDDNTYVNLIPILTGQTMDELFDTCWENKFDKCHIIWKNFSDNGYLTAFAEENSVSGLFNYHRLGFKEQPTHYYWNTFDLYAENKTLIDNCLGARPIHQVMLEYTKKFLSRNKDEPFFGFFMSSILTHNCLNCPSLGDNDYVEFFDGLKKDNVFNNTAVIFFSDHGLRVGDILETYQGYLEERLPLLYFIFPPWFNEQYPRAIKNMRDNSNRLTVNFDIYETLLDLVDVDKLKTKYLRDNETSGIKRGISLFSLVPENRSCEMAGIASHWCSCKKRYEIFTYSTAVKKIANFIVSQINGLLENKTECAQLKLKTINSAYLSKLYYGHDSESKVYTIKLMTLPNEAIFQSTVRCNEECYDEKSFIISGRITRLNRYRNQSSCISNRELKMFCYCI